MALLEQTIELSPEIAIDDEDNSEQKEAYRPRSLKAVHAHLPWTKEVLCVVSSAIPYYFCDRRMIDCDHFMLGLEVIGVGYA